MFMFEEVRLKDKGQTLRRVNDAQQYKYTRHLHFRTILDVSIVGIQKCSLTIPGCTSFVSLQPISYDYYASKGYCF